MSLCFENYATTFEARIIIKLFETKSMNIKLNNKIRKSDSVVEVVHTNILCSGCMYVAWEKILNEIRDTTFF